MDICKAGESNSGPGFLSYRPRKYGFSWFCGSWRRRRQLGAALRPLTDGANQDAQQMGGGKSNLGEVEERSSRLIGKKRQGGMDPRTRRP